MHCETVHPGQVLKLPEAQIFFKGAFRTNGGHMFDVSVTYDDKETEHRIIVGRDYYEFQGISPEEVVERVLGFLTRKKVPRHTEGTPHMQHHTLAPCAWCIVLDWALGFKAGHALGVHSMACMRFCRIEVNVAVCMARRLLDVH